MRDGIIMMVIKSTLIQKLTVRLIRKECNDKCPEIYISLQRISKLKLEV
jgi:hypothetical protein